MPSSYPKILSYLPQKEIQQYIQKLHSSTEGHKAGSILLGILKNNDPDIGMGGDWVGKDFTLFAGSSILHVCAMCGDIDTFNKALAIHADVNKKNSKNETPLSLAIAFDRNELIQHIALATDFDPNTTDHTGLTSFEQILNYDYASLPNKTPLIKQILHKHGHSINLNHTDNKNKITTMQAILKTQKLSLITETLQHCTNIKFSFAPEGSPEPSPIETIMANNHYIKTALQYHGKEICFNQDKDNSYTAINTPIVPFKLILGHIKKNHPDEIQKFFDHKNKQNKSSMDILLANIDDNKDKIQYIAQHYAQYIRLDKLVQQAFTDDNRKLFDIIAQYTPADTLHDSIIKYAAPEKHEQWIAENLKTDIRDIIKAYNNGPSAAYADALLAHNQPMANLIAASFPDMEITDRSTNKDDPSPSMLNALAESDEKHAVDNASKFIASNKISAKDFATPTKTPEDNKHNANEQDKPEQNKSKNKFLDEQGNNPIMRAAAKQNYQQVTTIISAILQHKPSPKERSEEKKLLLQAKNNNNQTLLHIISNAKKGKATLGSPEQSITNIVDEYVELTPQCLKEKDKDGKTPIDNLLEKENNNLLTQIAGKKAGLHILQEYMCNNFKDVCTIISGHKSTSTIQSLEDNRILDQKTKNLLLAEVAKIQCQSKQPQLLQNTMNTATEPLTENASVIHAACYNPNADIIKCVFQDITPEQVRNFTEPTNQIQQLIVAVAQNNNEEEHTKNITLIQNLQKKHPSIFSEPNKHNEECAIHTALRTHDPQIIDTALSCLPDKGLKLKGPPENNLLISIMIDSPPPYVIQKIVARALPSDWQAAEQFMQSNKEKNLHCTTSITKLKTINGPLQLLREKGPSQTAALYKELVMETITRAANKIGALIKLTKPNEYIPARSLPEPIAPTPTAKTVDHIAQSSHAIDASTINQKETKENISFKREISEAPKEEPTKPSEPKPETESLLLKSINTHRAENQKQQK